MPPDATAALAQLGEPTQINNADANAANPIDLILTEDGMCNYVSPEGKACGEPRVKKDRDQARHWITCHMNKELTCIEAGELEMSNARIITTEAKKAVAALYQSSCPVTRCESTVLFTRKDALVRHMLICAKRHKIQLSRRKANKQARKRMEVFHQPSEFGRGYLGAVQRIHQA